MTIMTKINNPSLFRLCSWQFLLIVFGILFFVHSAEAASLRLSPETGFYQAGATFTATVQVDTGGQAINSAEGTLSFNPDELAVIAVSRDSSIFNLWVNEPSFSNTDGTVSFRGGVPTGYSGTVGDVLTIQFRVKNAGTPRVNFNSGVVLAHDGLGTNILTSLEGASYTAQAVVSEPAPEQVIVEYIAQANTPDIPAITSDTHSDQESWYTNTTAVLNWVVPNDVTAVRTLLDESMNSIPTKVYQTPIDTITLPDLPDGESYFHLQFKNDSGWGRVAHYRLAVDTEVPRDLALTLATDDAANPEQSLSVTCNESVSGIEVFRVKLDDQEPLDLNITASGTLQLPALTPGYHTAIVEAVDKAGNSTIATISFTIESFESPIFTTIPTEINSNVIPVIFGKTRPYATVSVLFTRLGGEPSSYELQSDGAGEFRFVPEGHLYNGVYEISAQAIDQTGAQSEFSEVVRIAVQEPGFVRIGGYVVSILSVLVPVAVLLVGLLFGTWHTYHVFRRFRGAVRTESTEALQILHREFGKLRAELDYQEENLQASRSNKKLTNSEAEMLKSMKDALKQSEDKVEKEIADVTKLT